MTWLIEVWRPFGRLMWIGKEGEGWRDVVNKAQLDDPVWKGKSGKVHIRVKRDYDPNHVGPIAL